MRETEWLRAAVISARGLNRLAANSASLWDSVRGVTPSCARLWQETQAAASVGCIFRLAFNAVGQLLHARCSPWRLSQTTPTMSESITALTSQSSSRHFSRCRKYQSRLQTLATRILLT